MDVWVFLMRRLCECTRRVYAPLKMVLSSIFRTVFCPPRPSAEQLCATVIDKYDSASQTHITYNVSH